MTWDQAKYDRLRDELAAMERTRAGYLDALAQVLDEILGKEPPTGPMPVGAPRAFTRAERFASNADQLRDALAPFDSGVRAPTKAEPVLHANDICSRLGRTWDTHSWVRVGNGVSRCQHCGDEISI